MGKIGIDKVNWYLFLSRDRDLLFHFRIFSPLTDEVSLVAIAYLSKTGLVNNAGAGVVSFLTLYEAICLGLFIGIYYTLGLFFHNKVESFLKQMNVVQGSISLGDFYKLNHCYSEYS